MTEISYQVQRNGISFCSEVIPENSRRRRSI